MLPIGLSFKQAPPLSVPFRFFLTAPLFLLAAAILLTVGGSDSLASRHTPIMLAVTHLVTLGFTSMVMCGATLQMLPVLAGVTLPHPKTVAWLVHTPLLLGAIGIPATFLVPNSGLMHLAVLCLAIGFGIFILVMAKSLWHAPGSNPSVVAMRFAIAGLVVTITLGIALDSARFGNLVIPYFPLARLHPLWGLYGWTMLLIMGVAYQVMPMFYLTAHYPRFITEWLVTGLFLLLALHAFASLVPSPVGNELNGLSNVALAGGAALFAITTSKLLASRKRKVSDTTLRFWQTAMLALLSGVLTWVSAEVWKSPLNERMQLTYGVMVLVGFVLTVIQAMLYKIVPFLVWFHLQANYPRLGVVPNVRQIQAGFHAEHQLKLHWLALALLLSSCWWPGLTRFSGIAWAFNALWLAANLLRATLIFRKTTNVAIAMKAD